MLTRGTTIGAMYAGLHRRIDTRETRVSARSPHPPTRGRLYYYYYIYYISCNRSSSGFHYHRVRRRRIPADVIDYWLLGAQPVAG